MKNEPTFERATLLPDPAAMVPAKAALLRKLVKAALTKAGYAASVFSGGLRFLSPAGILVDCDFGSRMGQLRWQVAAGATRPTHGLIETALDVLRRAVAPARRLGRPDRGERRPLRRHPDPPDRQGGGDGLAHGRLVPTASASPG